MTTFTNSGLSSSTQYFYRVRATNAGGNSSNSGTASGTTLAGPPSAPTGLTAAALSGSEIRLNWTDTASNETGFQIDRSLDGTTGWAQVGTVGSNVTTFTNTGLTVSTTYFYRVRSVSAGGQSANSATANATTTTQTVTYLSDLPFVGTPVNGWGPVERDRSNGEQGATDGIAMKIGGVTYTKGLGVHSTSQIVFNLGGGYTTFLADIGIDDEVGNAGSVIFQVLADGVSIFTSASLTGRECRAIDQSQCDGRYAAAIERQSIDERERRRPCRLGERTAALGTRRDACLAIDCAGNARGRQHGVDG